MSNNEIEQFQEEAAELLATEIVRTGTDAFKGLENFKNFIVDSNVNMSDKQNQLLKLQLTLFGQMMTPLIGGDIDPIADRKAKMAKSLYHILDSISASIYQKAEYDEKSEVDFFHPKIQKAFDFLTEGVIESLQEIGVANETINSFLSIFAVKMVGFETELNSRMKGIRGASLDRINNPLMSAYKQQRKDLKEGVTVDAHLRVKW